MKKGICLVILALVLLLGGSLVWKYISEQQCLKELKADKIELTELEREMFQTYFDMELPDYIFVLNCEYRFDDNCFFAAKAVMARKDVSRFTHYIEQGHDARAQINMNLVIRPWQMILERNFRGGNETKPAYPTII